MGWVQVDKRGAVLCADMFLFKNKKTFQIYHFFLLINGIMNPDQRRI